MRRVLGRLRAARGGQMTVELACLVPVAVVVALMVYNLMGFVDACAAFDRLALDAVVAHGVAPAGAQTQESGAAQVRDAVVSALGREETCEVSVDVQDLEGGGEAETFVVSPLLRRFVCTLTYRPWPRYLRLPGVTYEAPLALRHERSIVVDRYRPGAVM